MKRIKMKRNETNPKIGKNKKNKTKRKDRKKTIYFIF